MKKQFQNNKKFNSFFINFTKKKPQKAKKNKLKTDAITVTVKKKMKEKNLKYYEIT